MMLVPYVVLRLNTPKWQKAGMEISTVLEEVNLLSFPGVPKAPSNAKRAKPCKGGECVLQCGCDSTQPLCPTVKHAVREAPQGRSEGGAVWAWDTPFLILFLV